MFDSDIYMALNVSYHLETNLLGALRQHLSTSPISRKPGKQTKVQGFTHDGFFGL